MPTVATAGVVFEHILWLENQKRYLDYYCDTPWARWLVEVLPETFVPRSGRFVAFADCHREFWEWVWSIEPDTPVEAFLPVLARDSGKSTGAEAAVVFLAGERKRRYAIYSCHASGTRICDPDLGWMVVDAHPTARLRKAVGVRVEMAGLPYPEVVTQDHRYWARRVARRDVGKPKQAQLMMTPPRWTEAEQLDWNTWIGYPIDYIVADRDPQLTFRGEPYVLNAFADPDFWWAIGLFWGDGSMSGPGGIGAVSWSCADAHPWIINKLVTTLR